MTVFPNVDPYTEVAGTPACRLPDPTDPTFPYKYVYMESALERAARMVNETADEFNIAMGQLVQFRDNALSAIGSVFRPTLGLVLGAVALYVFLTRRRR